MFKACNGQVCSLKIPSVRVQHQRVLIKRMRNARLFWQLLSCRIWGQQQLLRLLQLFIWLLSACLLSKLFCVRLRVQLLVLLLLALSESRAHIAWGKQDVQVWLTFPSAWVLAKGMPTWKDPPRAPLTPELHDWYRWSASTVAAATRKCLQADVGMTRQPAKGATGLLPWQPSDQFWAWPQHTRDLLRESTKSSQLSRGAD